MQYQIVSTITKPRLYARNGHVHTIHVFTGALYSECVLDYFAYTYHGWKYPARKMTDSGVFYKTIKVDGKQHNVVTQDALRFMIKFCKAQIPPSVLNELKLFDMDPEHKGVPSDHLLLQATPFAKSITPFYIDGTRVNIYYPELNVAVDVAEKTPEAVDAVKAELKCEYRVVSQENIFEVVGLITKLHIDNLQRETHAQIPEK